MIKSIVVDDEWYNLEEISDLIGNTGFIKVVNKYQNPILALEQVKDILPEVAFIDIEMPGIDGITLAERLLEQCPGILIVFITSWNQYAVTAFDLNAIDYIMKPIKIERFNRMIDKIKNELEANKSYKAKKLKVICFNKLETSIGGIAIKWERAKAEELFAYLLMNHDCYIHKDTIVQNLWANYEPLKALQILQTSVCRIRNIFSKFSKEVILNYSGSKYCLVISNVECDFLVVEQALAVFRIENESTYATIENALLIFQKGFLVQQGYLWSIEKDEELRKRFIQILNDIVIKYKTQHNDKEVCRFLKYLSVLTPYDDNLNYTLLKTLKDNGDNYSSFIHYQWLKDILKEEYDTVPSEIINSLFI